jgi:hypothetical protein
MESINSFLNCTIALLHYCTIALAKYTFHIITTTIMSHGFSSTTGISNSRAPCCFAMKTADEGKLPPSLLSSRDLRVVEPNAKIPDLAIEYENSIVDLSNLVSSRRSLLSGRVPNNKNSGLEKPAKSLRRLYSSKSKADLFKDVNNAVVMEQQFQPRRRKMLPRQASIIRRRSKMDQNKSEDYYGSSSRCFGDDVASPRLNLSSYSLDEVQEFKSLPPGAYDCTSTDTYEGPLACNDYTPASTRAELEIAPGVFAALRGSQETMNAIREGDYVDVKCFCCAAKLLCISDAEYVLCPDCRVVSPLLDLPGKCDVGGVGLGLRAPSIPAVRPGLRAPSIPAVRPGLRSPSTPAEMEISPGVFAALRGSQETLSAIREGDCVNVNCFWCAAKLLCISDAEYVLCPDCKVLGPLDLPRKGGVGGVGLGLRVE